MLIYDRRNWAKIYPHINTGYSRNVNFTNRSYYKCRKSTEFNKIRSLIVLEANLTPLRRLFHLSLPSERKATKPTNIRVSDQALMITDNDCCNYQCKRRLYVH